MTTETSGAGGEPSAAASKRWRVYGLYGLALLFLIFLLFYRLDVYPTYWFDRATYMTVVKDESSYLNVARNYAQNGIYAEVTSEGENYTGAVISTGPTVILPIAFVFKLFGFSVPLARAVVAIGGLLTFAVLLALAVHLGDRRFAAVALALAVLSWGDLVPYVFRNVLGEGPGLIFLFAGLWLWLRPGRRSLPALLAVGLLMGLASITKNQYALFVLPSLLVAWLCDLFGYRQRGWRYFVVPGVVAGLVYAAWTYYVFFLIGAESRNVAEDVAALRAAAGQAYLVLDRSKIALNTLTLVRADVYVGLLIPAMLFGLILSLRRDEQGQRWGILTVFLAASVAIYVFSAGWYRLLVPPLMLGALFVARLLYSLTNGYRLDWRGVWAAATGRQPVSGPLVIHVLVIGLLLGLVVMPLGRAVYYVFGTGNRVPYEVAAYLDAHVPADAIIETWDKELAILSDRLYHHPPQVLENVYNAYQLYGEEAPGEVYHFRDEVDADYVVVGPFSHWTEVYTDQLQGYERVETMGAYTIYRRQQ